MSYQLVGFEGTALLGGVNNIGQAVSFHFVANSIIDNIYVLCIVFIALSRSHNTQLIVILSQLYLTRCIATRDVSSTLPSSTSTSTSTKYYMSDCNLRLLSLRRRVVWATAALSAL